MVLLWALLTPHSRSRSHIQVVFVERNVDVWCGVGAMNVKKTPTLLYFILLWCNGGGEVMFGMAIMQGWQWRRIEGDRDRRGF